MKALDTNVILRFLLNDDPKQSPQARRIFEAAEAGGESLAVTWPVLLETIWVFSAVYDFRRQEILEALELLARMPILEFQDYDALLRLIGLGRSTKAHLPDLLIGVAGQSIGCQTTLTFEKGLPATGLFEAAAGAGP